MGVGDWEGDLFSFCTGRGTGGGGERGRAEVTVRSMDGGLGGPDSGFGFEGGPGEPEVVGVDYGGQGLAF